MFLLEQMGQAGILLLLFMLCLSADLKTVILHKQVSQTTNWQLMLPYTELNKVSCYRNNVDIQFQIPVLPWYYRYFVVRCPCCTLTHLKYWPELAALSFLLAFCLTLYYSFMKLTGATSSILFCRCNSAFYYKLYCNSCYKDCKYPCD